jgi:hypothetical protein
VIELTSGLIARHVRVGQRAECMLFTETTLLTPIVVAPTDSGAGLEDDQAWIGKIYNKRAKAHMLNDAG